MKRKAMLLAVAVTGLVASGCLEDEKQFEKIKELERTVKVLETENRDLADELEKEIEKGAPRELADLRNEVKTLNRTIGQLQAKADQFDSMKRDFDRLKSRTDQTAARPAATASNPPPASPENAGKAPAATGAAAAGLLDAEGKVKSAVADAVVLIEGDQSVGSGFLGKDDGVVYLYTAAHVISGNNRLTIKNTAGTKFTKFGKMEVALDADLVRIRIDEEVANTLEVAKAGEGAELNTAIAALGNGGGGGVVAVEQGQILGSSGSQIEIDAGVIQGNSGGPVLVVETGKVVGVVTHLTAGRSDMWAEGTRQAEVRRFACRVNVDRKWTEMTVSAFLSDGRKVSAYDEMTLLGFAFARLEGGQMGLRYNPMRYGSRTPLQIFERNKNVPVVKELIDFNSGLESGRVKLGQVDRQKKIASLMASMKFQIEQTAGQIKPDELNPYHKKMAHEGIKARQECVSDLTSVLAGMR